MKNKGTKYCDRCQAEFLLSEHDSEWTAVLQAYLKESVYESICESCADEISETLLKSNFTLVPKSLLPQIHYYIEGGKWVFTELYHLQKGYCCHNRCRHCPYGRGPLIAE